MTTTRNDQAPSSFTFAGIYSDHQTSVFPPRAEMFENDEARRIQMQILKDRKLRKRISNRDSARRSRMRKQKYVDELWQQVINLRGWNQRLVAELNRVTALLDQILRENSNLRDEISHLHQS
ncbi:hypothetical protein ZOSMA_221G00110 [Zostera marina]|uniref:BZIP domain-containing protein n=1 Tax=Zostera marina TaxID=29655 RepID=A0A0K9PLL2_ZOSMR|nr:hypothetical protein ZOSMA_221G00110 [Zostera marina]